MTTGGLESVFRPARRTRGFMDETVRATLFDWLLGLSWACQIMRGIVELQSVSAYNEDLKSKNVLINSSGQAPLFDFLLVGNSRSPGGREKYHGGVTEFQSVLTVSADAHPPNLLLYTVTEEKCVEWQYGRTCA
jgi:hypothetical protein